MGYNRGEAIWRKTVVFDRGEGNFPNNTKFHLEKAREKKGEGKGKRERESDGGCRAEYEAHDDDDGRCGGGGGGGRAARGRRWSEEGRE